MPEADRSRVMPNITFGSRKKNRHHMQARAIPTNAQINSYLSVLISCSRDETFSYR